MKTFKWEKTTTHHAAIKNFKINQHTTAQADENFWEADLRKESFQPSEHSQIVGTLFSLSPNSETLQDNLLASYNMSN